MITVCAWCKIVMKATLADEVDFVLTAPEEYLQPVSHGLCAWCERVELGLDSKEDEE